jgi:hypothetical protein
MFRKRSLALGTVRQDYTRGATHCQTRPDLPGTVSERRYTIYGNRRFICDVARTFLVHFFINISCLSTIFSAFRCCFENLLVYFSSSFVSFTRDLRSHFYFYPHSLYYKFTCTWRGENNIEPTSDNTYKTCLTHITLFRLRRNSSHFTYSSHYIAPGRIRSYSIRNRLKHNSQLYSLYFIIIEERVTQTLAIYLLCSLNLLQAYHRGALNRSATCPHVHSAYCGISSLNMSHDCRCRGRGGPAWLMPKSVWNRTSSSSRPPLSV